MAAKDICINTLENYSPQNNCSVALQGGQTCNHFLTAKTCDKECNLCSCSTAGPDSNAVQSQHCSSRGRCEANCNRFAIGSKLKENCYGAKCVCNPGYGGHQCQLGNDIARILYSRNHRFKTYSQNLLLVQKFLII